MTSTILMLTSVISIISLILVIAFILRQKNQSIDVSQKFENLQNQLRLNLDGNTQLMQQQLNNLTQQLDQRLHKTMEISHETGKATHERLDNAARVISELQNRLGKLSEANEKIYNVGKDISSLQEILRHPKTRGVMGEIFLGNLLEQMIPQEHYELQYGFKNNEKVDAVIKVGQQLISIDAKFPLENFKRLVEAEEEKDKIQFKKQFINDVKKHIDSISKKYIRPNEGTYDFAFMYIPAENVFYETIIRDHIDSDAVSLETYALKKRVIPVSPNSFYAYLAALMQALKGQKLQDNILEISAQIRNLSVELGKFQNDFEKVGYHLNNLKNSYDQSEKRLQRYQDRLERVFEAEADFLPEDKPVKLVK